MNEVIVSVVMPIYNEEKHIEGCIESLLAQTYPKENMEWIFVDGMSTDRTPEIIGEYVRKYPRLMRIVENPKRNVPCAMNLGIESSKGKYLIRLDAHSDYAEDYIAKCVYYLENTDAENVGGVAETKAVGAVGRAISKMLSSKFGVGNSQFRTNGKSGYVDTVPFGAFRREIFKKYGGYDERLIRNQDNEMNFRIRKNGGKIYLSDEIKLSYYCRSNIKGIVNMAMANGKWNVITMKMCPGSMGLRHFVPLFFVLSLIGIPLLGIAHWAFFIILGAELLLYALLDAVFSLKKASSVSEFLLLTALFPIFHISYGLGSLGGIFKLFQKKYRKNDYQLKYI